ncbi:hypothetical protein A4A49_58219 [Nicotiana attenuata]|uniref:Uncharacterized protein n=1 Tax=Nicotiana attenuata TaxID=49451 RepID=A0A314KYI6_NICAT|nr:hypothetical protein A4A49_58219 [Nicotiana attenuata]
MGFSNDSVMSTHNCFIFSPSVFASSSVNAADKKLSKISSSLFLKAFSPVNRDPYDPNFIGFNIFPSPALLSQFLNRPLCKVVFHVGLFS